MEEKEPQPAWTQQTSENTVFIGRKHVMNYVVACLTFLNSSKKGILKVRRRTISRTVDTVELLKRILVKDLQLKNISICIEQVAGRESKTRNVSTLELDVAKP